MYLFNKLFNFFINKLLINICKGKVYAAYKNLICHLLSIGYLKL